MSGVNPSGARREVIRLPAGTRYVGFGDLAHLIAAAQWPEDIDPGRLDYGLNRATLDRQLHDAVRAGELTVRDQRTRVPYPADIPSNILGMAVVTVADLRAFAQGLGVEVEEGGTAQQQAAPVDIGRGVKPPQAHQAQEAEVLRVLRELGYEPTRLPPRPAGKAWVKSEAWSKIGVCQLFASEGVFDKAWERLRGSGLVAERIGM